MRQNINEDYNQEDIVLLKRINLRKSEWKDFAKKDLNEFVGPESKKNFQRFNLDCSFLDISASKWLTNEAYINGKTLLKQIAVVNDTAERGVKLIEEYNQKLSTDEEQKQYIVQVVSNYRKNFPDHKKKTLAVELEDCMK